MTLINASTIFFNGLMVTLVTIEIKLLMKEWV